MAAKQIEGSNSGVSGEQIAGISARSGDDKLASSEHMTACKAQWRIRNVMKERRGRATWRRCARYRRAPSSVQSSSHRRLEDATATSGDHAGGARRVRDNSFGKCRL
jgi:hypothetical protein